MFCYGKLECKLEHVSDEFFHGSLILFTFSCLSKAKVLLSRGRGSLTVLFPADQAP